MPQAAIPNGLNKFQSLLIGSWTNAALPKATGGEGGPDNPLSYNVMPLPQDPPGYILKNFSYYENIEFESDADIALPATAPNRGNTDLQLPTALFYDQQVFFAEGPGKGTVVHVENGAWLNIERGDKLVGPYAAPKVDPHPANPQPPNITIAKQMSVPHGNSILALGSYTEPTDGAPSIHDGPSTVPSPSTDLDLSVYKQKLDQPNNYQNPQPGLTANPSQPLQDAIAKFIKPNKYIGWTVSTGNQGATMNIPFEQRAASVTDYIASYWLLSTDGGGTYPYLAYVQNIVMQFTIKGRHYKFPHVTSNVVTKK